MAPIDRTAAILALLVGLAVAGGRAAWEPVPATISGTAIVMEARYKGRRSERILAVATEEGSRVQVHLQDSHQIQSIRTGMQVHAAGTWEPAHSADSVQALSEGAPPPALSFRASSLSIGGGEVTGPTVTEAVVVPSSAGGVVTAAAATAPKGRRISLSTNRLAARDISTLVIPISGRDSSGAACTGTALPWNTPDDVRRAVLSEANPNRITVGSTYNQCSYGKSRLTANNSMVADTVVLPCDGQIYGRSWSFSKCEFSDFDGVSSAAFEALRAQGVPVDSYRHKVFLLPPGPCSFVGLGYVGCGASDCRAWIGGGWWNSSQAMVHEIGHNLFLDHAGKQMDWGFDEYADDSGAMGYCCADRCFNTPHAWQLGWISVQQLDGASLGPGVTLSVQLSSQSMSATSGVRIIPDWAQGVDPVFVGYRTAQRGDRMLAAFKRKLTVHTAAISGSQDPKVTTLRTDLSVGDAYTLPEAGLVLRFFRSTPLGTAVLRVCRKAGPETLDSCTRNLDNDCNGLWGPADPACAVLLRRSNRA